MKNECRNLNYVDAAKYPSKTRKRFEQRLLENRILNSVLETLKEQYQLLYLSDLHDPLYRDKIILNLSILDIHTFPLTIWTRLLYYITHKNLKFHTIEDVDVFLKKERGRCDGSKKGHPTNT